MAPIQLKQAGFRLGIFTSAMTKFTQSARDMIESACGGKLFEPGLILHRAHTRYGRGKGEDIKPLSTYFSKLHRVILFDDTAEKAQTGKKGNMVIVPCWDEDSSCSVLSELVDATPEALKDLGPKSDVRPSAAN